MVSKAPIKKESHLPASLDSLSSLRSEVKIDLARLDKLVFFEIELILDGTGDGVLRIEAGFDVDCPDWSGPGGFTEGGALSFGAGVLGALPF